MLATLSTGYVACQCVFAWITSEKNVLFKGKTFSQQSKEFSGEKFPQQEKNSHNKKKILTTRKKLSQQKKIIMIKKNVTPVEQLSQQNKRNFSQCKKNSGNSRKIRTTKQQQKIIDVREKSNIVLIYNIIYSSSSLCKQDFIIFENLFDHFKIIVEELQGYRQICQQLVFLQKPIQVHFKVND